MSHYRTRHCVAVDGLQLGTGGDVSQERDNPRTMFRAAR